MTVITYPLEIETREGAAVETNSEFSGDDNRAADLEEEGLGLEYEAPAVAMRSMKGQWATMARDIVIGLAALVVGVLGLILPVLPGWILIFVGLALIAGYVPPLRRALSRLLRSNPATRSLASVANRSVTRKGFARVMAMRPVRNAIDSETRWRTLHNVLKARADERSRCSDEDEYKTASDESGEPK